MTDRIHAGAALAGALSLLIMVGACRPDAARPPDQQDNPRRSILLITIDTLRADHLSAYGYERPTSPNIDALLGRGTRFEWALATSSYTAPSHISIMTGLYPSMNTVGLDNGKYFRLADATVTLAELCRDAGMRTAAVVSNPTLNRRLGLDQGFESYDDIALHRHDRRSPDRRADQTIPLAVHQLRELGDGPFFLWVHLQDPHGPYRPPPDVVQSLRHQPLGHAGDRELEFGTDESGYQSIPRYQRHESQRRLNEYVDRYDGEIRFLDRQMAALIAEIDRRELRDRTMVVFTADHGEALGEDGFYFAHSQSVGMEQMRVPLGFIGPGVSPNRVIRQPVSNRDVFATLLDFLGIPVPVGDVGHSLLPVLTGRGSVPGNPIFVESWTQRGVVAGDAFLRRDRRPAADQTFWGMGNPNNEGVAVPLGEEFVHLHRRDAPDADLPTYLRQSLDRYQARAEAALASSRRELARQPQLNFREIKGLQDLGYIGVDGDVPTTAPSTNDGAAGPPSAGPSE